MTKKVIQNPAALAVGLLALAGGIYMAQLISRISPALAEDVTLSRRLMEVSTLEEDFAIESPLMAPYL
jgi:hypothetical protein